MLSSRNPEDLDPALTPAGVALSKAEAELTSMRNGLLAAREYADAKAKEAIQAKVDLSEMERAYTSLHITSQSNLLYWKLATIVLALVSALLILALAITNL